MYKLYLIIVFSSISLVALAQNSDNTNTDLTNGESVTELYQSILEEHKGKLIFIDFWATWCGPCIQVINELKPLKKELIDEDIVFVYITNPGSPMEIWEAMTEDLTGDHYRADSSQWNQLKKKFGIITIPYQVLVGRDGEIIKTNVRFSERKWYQQFFEEHLKSRQLKR